MKQELKRFYHQVRRHIIWRVYNLMAHNVHLRPTGLHTSSQALAALPGSAATYAEVYPAYTSHLAVPEVFVEMSPAYFERAAEVEHVGPAFVLALPGGRLSVDNRNTLAIVAADNYLVGDVSLQFAPGTLSVADPTHNPIFGQRYFREPLEIKGTVCSLLSGGGAGISNYYHWLLDSLPRLHLIKQAGLWNEVDYFLIYSREHHFVMETLLALGIRNEQILDVQTATHLRAERLLVTSPVRGLGRHAPTWVGDYLKESYLPMVTGAARPTHFSPLVYVSRRDASFRQVRNEAAVEALLAEYGFESYALTELSFREKVALFAGARAVVGPVGAGMANILFCEPGTPMVEFLPRNFVVADYLDLTTRLGMPHYPLISARDSKSGGHAHADRQDDLTVDLDALRRTLHQALAMPAPAAVGTAASVLAPA